MDGRIILFDPRRPIETESSDEPESYKRVWMAVLEQAFIDANSSSEQSDRRNIKKGAIAWLTGDEKAFEDVCLKAGLDPQKVRDLALKLYS